MSESMTKPCPSCGGTMERWTSPDGFRWVCENWCNGSPENATEIVEIGGVDKAILPDGRPLEAAGGPKRVIKAVDPGEDPEEALRRLSAPPSGVVDSPSTD